MKKKILVSALVLASLIGVASGAYMLYDYNEHKPLILGCKISEATADPSLVGGGYLLKIEASVYGWSSGPRDGLGSAPHYWSFDEEQWKSFKHSGLSTLGADKNRFEWQVSDFQLMRIDRNSGDFSILSCPSRLSALRDCQTAMLFEQDLTVVGRGSCAKMDEPAKTLKQRF